MQINIPYTDRTFYSFEVDEKSWEVIGVKELYKNGNGKTYTKTRAPNNVPKGVWLKFITELAKEI